MRLSIKDGAATVLVGAVVVAYVGYLVRGSMPFIQDARGMAVAGLVLGSVACGFGGAPAARAGRWPWVAGVLGAVTLVAGIGALVAGSGMLLAVFVGGIVALWALATVRHAVAGPVDQARPREPATHR